MAACRDPSPSRCLVSGSSPEAVGGIVTTMADTPETDGNSSMDSGICLTMPDGCRPDGRKLAALGTT